MGFIDRYIKRKIGEVMQTPRNPDAAMSPYTEVGRYAGSSGRLGTGNMFEVAKIENGYLVAAYTDGAIPRYTYVESPEGLGDAITAWMVKLKLEADQYEAELGKTGQSLNRKLRAAIGASYQAGGGFQ